MPETSENNQNDSNNSTTVAGSENQGTENIDKDKEKKPRLGILDFVIVAVAAAFVGWPLALVGVGVAALVNSEYREKLSGTWSSINNSSQSLKSNRQVNSAATANQVSQETSIPVAQAVPIPNSTPDGKSIPVAQAVPIPNSTPDGTSMLIDKQAESFQDPLLDPKIGLGIPVNTLNPDFQASPPQVSTEEYVQYVPGELELDIPQAIAYTYDPSTNTPDEEAVIEEKVKIEIEAEAMTHRDNSIPIAVAELVSTENGEDQRGLNATNSNLDNMTKPINVGQDNEASFRRGNRGGKVNKKTVAHKNKTSPRLGRP